MSAVAAAIGVVGITGAILASNASSSAADKQAGSANAATQLQWQEFQQQQANYQQQQADIAPWRQAGQGALSQMQNPYFQQQFSGADMMQNDPGYQFRLQQGTDALQASAAARGTLGSGNTLTGITNYAQNYASNEYQNAYNRFNNNQTQSFNRLASVAGLGQTANGQMSQNMNNMGQLGSQFAGQVGNNMMGAANAQAAGQIGQANAWSGALSGAGNSWMNYSLMNRMMPQQPSPGGGGTGSPPGIPSSAYSGIDSSSYDPNGLYIGGINYAD